MRRILVLVVLFGLVAAGCTSDEGGSDTTPATGGGEEQVEMADLAFSPDNLTVAAGTTVTWTNNDSVDHTVDTEDGTLDSGNLGNGDEFSFTFSEAGTFDYFCSIHPTMTGTIVVEG